MQYSALRSRLHASEELSSVSVHRTRIPVSPQGLFSPHFSFSLLPPSYFRPFWLGSKSPATCNAILYLLRASFRKSLLPQISPDYVQMRVTVRPQGSITLYGRRELPLMEIRIVTSATVEKREDTSMVSCAKWNKPERLFHVKIVA